MARVTVDGEPYEAAPGERLSDLLLRAGKYLPMPCGGRGTCGKCLVTVNGAPALACRTVADTGLTVQLPPPETVVSETGAEETGGEGSGPAALALDIGTTTLALALVSLREGRAVRTVTRVNPQRAFGADVMSRIGWCMAHGPAAPHAALAEAVNGMLAELAAPPGLPLYAAGNTTMLHLFFGADPSGMGAAPYTPAFLASKTDSGESLGLNGVETAASLPCAAAFVGADLTAGLFYVGPPPAGKYRLLVDLGTNAEVVLFSREGALCTAAAAGPCFEGANISCGMSASPGAICAWSAAGYETVGGRPAAGLCGTGLVDAVAALIADGTIDETGYMECGRFALAPGVELTQADVRQYQLAKSAVCSAVQALMERQGVGFDAIDALYLSGGFSSKIDIGHAAGTGLFPPELREKCVALHNTSLLGTVKYAAERPDLADVTARTRYVDLAADPVFSALFIEKMTF